MASPADYAIGAFSAHPPWTVDPEAMPWRANIDALRAEAARQVPGLVQARRLPPARGALVGLKMAVTVAPWVLKNRRRASAPEAQADLAQLLRPAFESLGATFIKLGQLIASAEGMLPDVWVQEFKSCRDRVAPESYDHVRNVIESDFGRSMDDLFARFDRAPLAAASIAQVHSALLHTGEEVVVKVQRPGIARAVSQDIATMSWIAAIIERRRPDIAIANLPAYVELFADTIVEELDFRLEAQNMLDIAAVLAVNEQRAVVIPRPHPELVTRRVLVMERLSGLSLDDETVLKDAGIDPAPVYRALMVGFLEGAMIHGVFHGDLHGGNMVVGEDGRPVIYDFGITGRFPENRRNALLGLMVSSTTRDPRALLTHFRDLGGFPADTDVDELAKELNIEQLMADDGPTVRQDQMALELRETMKRLVAHGATLPKELFLFMKGMVYLTGAVNAMAVNVDMFAEMGHIFDVFNNRHGGHLAALGLENMPDVAVMQERMRERLGVDADSMTMGEMRAARDNRFRERRARRRAK